MLAVDARPRPGSLLELEKVLALEDGLPHEVRLGCGGRVGAPPRLAGRACVGWGLLSDLPSPPSCTCTSPHRGDPSRQLGAAARARGRLF